MVLTICSASRRVELGFFEQAESAREIVDHFLAAVLKFELAPAQFLERGAFAFQILLRAFQLGEFLLRLDDFAVHLVARGRAKRIVGCREWRRRFVRLKIRVNKFGRVVFSHVATLTPLQFCVKRCLHLSRSRASPKLHHRLAMIF
jgi:hypothetical protein